MKAITWEGGERYVLGEAPRPRAARGQLVVRVEATGICGSDLHLADFADTPPVVPGHEAAGTIEELGEGVRDRSVGERVAINPVQWCGACYACTHGIKHLCSNVRHLGTRETPGTWAEYVTVDAANVHPVPQGVSTAAAALTEPVAVCYESLQRAAPLPGQSVLIVGDGPFGFLHAQIAVTMEADPVIVAGHYDKRLERIASMTGALTCNTHEEDVVTFIERAGGGAGIDVAIEATGATASPNLCLRALRPRGTMVVFSSIWAPEPMDMLLIQMRELSILGSVRSLDAFPTCLQLMDSGGVNVEALADVRLPLEEFESALTILRRQKAEVFKALLTMRRNSDA